MDTFLPHFPEFDASPDTIRRLLTLGNFMLRIEGKNYTSDVRNVLNNLVCIFSKEISKEKQFWESVFLYQGTNDHGYLIWKVFYVCVRKVIELF
jgi:hypothetical protein